MTVDNLRKCDKDDYQLLHEMPVLLALFENSGICSFITVYVVVSTLCIS